MKKSFLLKFIAIFLVLAMMLPIIGNTVYATSITKTDVTNVLKKYYTETLTVTESNGDTSNDESFNYSNITYGDSNIVYKYDNTDYEIITYSLEGNTLTFNVDALKIKEILKQEILTNPELISMLNGMEMETDDLAAIKALALETASTLALCKCYLCTSVAIGVDISTAYSYFVQQVDKVSNDENALTTGNTFDSVINDIFSLTKVNNADIPNRVDSMTLTINLDNFANLTEAQLDPSIPALSVYFNCWIPAKVKGVTNKTQDTKSITLKWNKASRAEAYRVYQYDSSSKKYIRVGQTTDTSYKVTGLKTGTTYKFKVRALKNVNGKNYFGSYSDVIKLTTKPSKPTITSVKSNKKQRITVKWKKVSNANGYEIQYSRYKDFKKDKIVVITKNSTVTKTLSTRYAKTKYYVRMRTYRQENNKKVYSSYSTVKSLKVK